MFVLLGTVTFPQTNALAQEDELYFTNLEVEVLEDSEVRIEWATNSPSFYLLEFGLTDEYGESIRGTTSKQSHEVLLRNLEPKKTYHFRIISYTSDNIRSVTFDQTFKTKKEIDDEIPELVLFRIPIVTDTAAYIYIQTNESAKTTITYWEQNKPNKTYKKTISSSKGDFSGQATIKKLEPATVYVYTYEIKDDAGNVASFFEQTFQTETTAFKLNDLAIENITPLDNNAPSITEDSSEITFTTTRPARCSVTHKKKNKRGGTTIKEPDLKKWQHSFEVDELTPGTVYSYKVNCTDFLGKKISSDNFLYATKGTAPNKNTKEDDGELFGGKKFTLMKSNSSPRVYVVFKKQKYHIKNPDIYRSYELQDYPIEVVSQDKLDSYANTRLVKNSSGDKYFLYPNKNKKKHILSDSVNKSYDYNKKYDAIELNDFDLNTFQNLTLVKTADSPAVYYISEGVKRPIASWDVFLKRGWEPWEIGVINQKDLDSYTSSSLIE
ncbi:MAG: fibronectin type III domain-containing protein [Patescibacteria group bacterium]